jgi:hypothetical protein
MSACNAVLIPEINITILDESEKLATLDIVSEETWSRLDQERKRDLLIATGYGAAQGSEDYQKFTEERRSFFEKHFYSQDSARSLKQIRQRIPDRAIEAWERCMLSQNSNVGITAKAEWISENEVRVIVIAVLQSIIGGPTTVTVDGQGTCSGQLVSEPGVPINKAFPVGTVFHTGVPRVFRYQVDPDMKVFSLDANTSIGNVSCQLSRDRFQTVDIPFSLRDLIFSGYYTPFQPANVGGWNISLRAYLTLEDVDGDWYELRVHYSLSMNETNAPGNHQPNGMGNWTRTGEQTVARFPAYEAHLVGVHNDEFSEHVGWDGGRINHPGPSQTLVEGWTYDVDQCRAGFRLMDSVKVRIRLL